MTGIQETTAPIPPELLKDFILNRATGISRVPLYKIDLANSILKGTHLLSYIGNLRLCVELTNTGSKDDKFLLLEAYMGMAFSAAVNTLADEMADIILYRKGFDTTKEDAFLSKEERIEFSEKNDVTIKEWESFLDSVPTMAPFVFNFYSETVGKDLISSGTLEVIDNSLLVGVNALNLFYVPDFIEFYLSEVVSPLPRMYQKLFYSPCFEGQSLINVLLDNTSLLPFLHNMISTGEKYAELRSTEPTTLQEKPI